MPFSDTTKSSIQTASPSLGSSDLVRTRSSSSSSPTASSGNVVPTTRRMVRFGAVKVNKHRMTMGYNPSCEEGIPVTIDWSVQEWEFYEDPDAYMQAKEQQQQESQTESSNTNSNKDSSVVPKKLSQALREQIAQSNHTSDSILKVQDELDQIRRSRIAGMRDIYNATLMLQLQDDGFEEEEEIEPAKSQNEHGNDDETKKRFLRRKIVGCRSNRKFYLIKRRQRRVLILMQEAQSGAQPQ